MTKKLKRLAYNTLTNSLGSYLHKPKLKSEKIAGYKHLLNTLKTGAILKVNGLKTRFFNNQIPKKSNPFFLTKHNVEKEKIPAEKIGGDDNFLRNGSLSY